MELFLGTNQFMYIHLKRVFGQNPGWFILKNS